MKRLFAYAYIFYIMLFVNVAFRKSISHEGRLVPGTSDTRNLKLKLSVSAPLSFISQSNRRLTFVIFCSIPLHIDESIIKKHYLIWRRPFERTKRVIFCHSVTHQFTHSKIMENPIVSLRLSYCPYIRLYNNTI